MVLNVARLLKPSFIDWVRIYVQKSEEAIAGLLDSLVIAKDEISEVRVITATTGLIIVEITKASQEPHINKVMFMLLSETQQPHISSLNPH